MRMIPEAVDIIILHLLKYNFLNETRFAQAYTRGNSTIKNGGNNEL